MRCQAFLEMVPGKGSRQGEVKQGGKGKMVEAVGIEPTSEQLRSAASTCVAFRFLSRRGVWAESNPAPRPASVSIRDVARSQPRPIDLL